MTHAVYLQTWAFIPAVILCHLPHTLAHFVTELHFKVITGVSHYWLSELRLFPLDTGIWLKIKHHLIILWLSCEDVWKGLCFNFPPGHMGSCTCLCVVWAALMSHKNQELFSKHATRPAQIRHGELQIKQSSLISVQATYSISTVCMFWCIFLR